MQPLPIDPLLPALVAAAREGAVVLTAPTGSGKTTRVPPALLDAGLGPVVVVQPRRVAARLAARRIAAERGVRLGEEVGYSVRFDARVSPRTRLEVVTEGLLTRRLLSDPFLEDVGTVVLDEFHERSLDADVALAALRQVREVRPELRVVVMSATLDAAPVAAFLGARVLSGEGRAYPVEVRHDRRPDPRPPTLRAAAAVREVAGEGHVLVFLAGVADIRRVAEDLGDLNVLPLHGRLSAAEQDRALAPSDRPKVVLATNLAETSVTLEGVRAVVDAGEAKIASFDPAYGVTRLERRPISRAAADQRAGRAGRTGPGVCRRLWTEAEHRSRPAFETPEIRRSDLAETVLHLRTWGTDPRALAWLEPPPDGALRRAERLLDTLAADATLARLPVHPRLARALVEAHAAGCLSAVAAIAALTEERDPFDLPADDLLGRIAAVEGGPRRLRQVRDQLVAVARRALGPPDRDGEAAPEALARILLHGFPDRVARHRGGGRYVLAGGGSATVRAVTAPFLVAVALDADRVRIAAPLDVEDLPLEEALEVRFDPEREAVVQRRVRRYGELVVEEKPAHDVVPDPEEVARCLLEAAVADRSWLALSPDAERFLARARFLRRALPELDLPDLDPDHLLPEICLPHGPRSFADLRRVDWLAEWAPYRHLVDRHAPDRLEVPSGARVRLRYPDDGPPVLAVRMQQMFGLRETPRVAGVPVLLHLLAPNQRPVQVTRDLAGFWDRTWPEVRKDLRGRYPKHPWPEDPDQAQPTDGARRRR